MTQSKTASRDSTMRRAEWRTDPLRSCDARRDMILLLHLLLQCSGVERFQRTPAVNASR